MASTLRPPLASPGHAQESIADDIPPVTSKPKRQRRQEAIPKEIRTSIVQFASDLAKKHRGQFTPELKAKVLRLLRALLSPRPRRRGRPRDREISRAMTLLRRFRRKYPQAKSRENWDRVCLTLIPGFGEMSKLERDDARADLQTRVKSRRDLIRLRSKRQQKNRSCFSA